MIYHHHYPCPQIIYEAKSELPIPYSPRPCPGPATTSLFNWDSWLWASRFPCGCPWETEGSLSALRLAGGDRPSGCSQSRLCSHSWQPGPSTSRVLFWCEEGAAEGMGPGQYYELLSCWVPDPWSLSSHHEWCSCLIWGRAVSKVKSCSMTDHCPWWASVFLPMR